MSSEAIVTITHLGTQGDGVADYKGSRLFIPMTAPGDRVLLDPSHQNFRKILTPSATRQRPICKHFSHCGGCSLQHLSHDAYAEFKQTLVADMAARLGLTDSDQSSGPNNDIIKPLIEVGHHARRRIRCQIALYKGVVTIGFYAKKSHSVVDLTQCPTTDIRLFSSIEPLKQCLALLKKPSSLKEVELTLTDHGLDISFHADRPLHVADKAALSHHAKTHNFCRLSVITENNDAHHDYEIISNLHPTTITCGTTPLPLPVGGFVQATELGQEIMTALICDHLKSSRSIIELFSGNGGFTFPAITKTDARHITAIEGNPDASAALASAAMQQQMSEKVTSICRDLYRRPLKINELEGYDALIINPPRSGAGKQIDMIAQSLTANKNPITRIALISCSLGKCEKELSALLKAGYRIDSIIPVDQFYLSHHIEIVALLSAPSL
jgi:23S rRNA (uracil1939-C5)-methyltransferase